MLTGNFKLLFKVSDTAFQLPDHVLDDMRIRRDLGLQRGYAYSFELFANVNEMEKRYEHAVQLLAAAETLRARIGAPVEQENQKENEDALTRLRAQLGEVVYELAWAKGDHDHRSGDRARAELSESTLDGNSMMIHLVVLKANSPASKSWGVRHNRL
jgi:hypothetical protein